MRLSFLINFEASLNIWNCYGSGGLAGYAENANIIRARFPGHIKRILKDVQKILIDWVSRVLPKTLVLIRKRISCL